MKTRRMLFLFILGLIFIWLPISLGACSNLLPVGANSGSGQDIQSQVDTQVAATLVGYLVQTKVAANLVSGQATQEASIQQAPTATPAPTETPLPPPTATPIPPTVPPPPPPPTATEAPTAAAVVSAPAPEISANVNTNCRQGPSTYYKIDGYLLVGDVSYVYGRDSASLWWYIQNPDKSSLYCWVWTESTTVSGDTSAVPVVATSEYAEKSYTNWYASQYYGDYYGDGYYDNGSWCQPYYHNGKVYCYPNPVYCDPNDYWNCNYWQNNCNNWTNNCKCKYTYPNNCGNKFKWPNSCGKKPVCPVPTGNYWNYCNKYPKCCGLN
jgi:hypothetical protein